LTAKGINKPGKKSGQAILISAVTKIQALADGRRMAIEIIWVPGHEDVEGNEKADEPANEAPNRKEMTPISRDPPTSPSNRRDPNA
jgi:ribonuclease HI